MHPYEYILASSPGHSQLLMLHVELKAESGLGMRLVAIYMHISVGKNRFKNLMRHCTRCCKMLHCTRCCKMLHELDWVIPNMAHCVPVLYIVVMTILHLGGGGEYTIIKEGYVTTLYRVNMPRELWPLKATPTILGGVYSQTNAWSHSFIPYIALSHYQETTPSIRFTNSSRISACPNSTIYAFLSLLIVVTTATCICSSLPLLIPTSLVDTQTNSHA